MEPSLAPLGRRSRVPRQAQRLQPAAGEFDQVLLQGRDPEGVFHLVFLQLAVRPLGPDHELPVLPEEGRGHSIMGSLGVIEIAEDGPVLGALHGEIVM